MSEQANASVADPFAGQTLSGRFLVQRIAGQTPDAITYTGVDQRTGTPVRIQRPAVFRADAEVRSRLRSAGEMIARAKGVPGVVAPITSGVHAGVPFLVLPPVLGGTLADRLAQLNGSVSETAAARSIRVWLQPAAAILDSMHQLGVVHGRLTPEAIGFGAGNAPVIDGVPIRQMVTAIGGDAARVSDAVMQPYAAPEAASGVVGDPASDQYSLAAIVAECLGGARPGSRAGRQPDAAHAGIDLPPPVAKALAPRPKERFANCAAFAQAVIGALDSGAPSPRPTAAPVAGEAPLELESPEISTPRPGAPRATAAIDVPLELEEIETDAARRSARRFNEPPDEDLDITFTKAGESLLTPKSTYDRARSLAPARSAWRRMREGYGGLTRSRQQIARAVAGVLALMLVVWLVQTGWWAARSLSGAVQSVTEQVVDKLKPEVGTLKASGEQFAQRMRDLWNDIRPPEDGSEIPEGGVPVPSRVDAAGRVEGVPWPDRPQDLLAGTAIGDPSALVAEILGYKGIPITADGLGAFHIDDPEHRERPTWIGGFGMLKKPAAPPKALLHGTVVRHDPDGSSWVAQYVRGGIQQVWRLRGLQGKRVIAYTRVKSVKNPDAPEADGAAFVLDQGRTSCVAFVVTEGEINGGQWCEKESQKDGEVSYIPPTDIVSLSTLEADDESFADYRLRLQAVIDEIPEFHKGAEAALKQFKKQSK